MAPEKLFDYLEGKLPEDEREKLERDLVHDAKLQQQLASAREIDGAMRRARLESPAVARSGAMGRKVAAATAILFGVNVFIGLFFIFHQTQRGTAGTTRRSSLQENGAPPESEKEVAIRKQLQSSLEKSAAATFAPPRLEPGEIVLRVERSKWEAAATSVLAAASELGGNATRALPNENQIVIFIEVPASREWEFRRKINAPPVAENASSARAGKQLLQVRIAE
jgi:hypothetical protein